MSSVNSGWFGPLERKSNRLSHRYKQTKSKEVSKWLSMRHLVRSLNDDIIEQCYAQILQLFSKREIILLSLETSILSKSAQIIDILKSAQLSNLAPQTKNSNNFDDLPIESVHNICSFLNRSDLPCFKMVSVSIALIVFEIMKCYAVKVLNLNEITNTNEYKYVQNINVSNKLKLNRVQPFIKYKSLMDIYCHKYNISFENLLILKIIGSMTRQTNYAFFGKILRKMEALPPMIGTNGNKFKPCYYYSRSGKFNKNSPFYYQTICVGNKHYESKSFEELRFEDQFLQLSVPLSICTKENKKFSSNDIESKIKNGVTLLIFDKRNIYSVCEHTQLTNINPKINIYDICLLQYFDKYSQRIHNVRFVLLQHSSKDSIAKYIEKYLKCMDEKWSQKCLETVQKMRQFTMRLFVSENVFNIYNVSDGRHKKYRPYQLYIEESNSDSFRIVLFELNDKHSFFQSQKEMSLTEPMYSNICDFTKYANAKSEIDLEIVDYACDFSEKTKCLGVVCPNKLTLRVCPLTTYDMIKRKISLQFQQKISANNIEIFMSENSSSDKIEVVSGKQRIKVPKSKCLKWSIVPYDSLTQTQWDSFQIHIYDKTTKKELNKGFTWNWEQNGTDIHSDTHKTETEGNQFLDDWFIFSQNVYLNFNLKYKSTVRSEEKKSEQSLENESIQKSENTYQIVKVSRFIRHFIDTISNPMFGNKYEAIIDKYGNTQKYSFIVINERDIKHGIFKCYEGKDECMIFHHSTSECYNTHVFVVGNDRNLMKDECECDINGKEWFPILVLFRKEDGFLIGIDIIGHIMKIWITNQTKVEELVKKLNVSEDIVFDSFSRNDKELTLNDVICDENDGKTKELLITFKINSW